jgi:hypothetical protein
MMSEPKLAMGIYFHSRFRLSQPADVGIELNVENPIFLHLIQFTHLQVVKAETGGGNKSPEPVSALTSSPGWCNSFGSPEILSEPKPALGIYFHHWFRLSQPADV